MIKKSSKASPLFHKADLALKQAVRKVIQERKRTGEPLIVWKNGKVVRIPAKKLISGKY